MEDEATRASRVFGERLRSERLQKRITQEELAERVTEMGLPMYQSTIGKIESDTRALLLNEALALAAAIGVPLPVMLMPRIAERLSIAPRFDVDGASANAWLLVMMPLPGLGYDEEFFNRIATHSEKPVYQSQLDDDRFVSQLTTRSKPSTEDVLSRQIEKLEERIKRLEAERGKH